MNLLICMVLITLYVYKTINDDDDEKYFHRINDRDTRQQKNLAIVYITLSSSSLYLLITEFSNWFDQILFVYVHTQRHILYLCGALIVNPIVNYIWGTYDTYLFICCMCERIEHVFAITQRNIFHGHHRSQLNRELL